MNAVTANPNRLLDSSRLREWSRVRSGRVLVRLLLEYVWAGLAAGVAVWFHVMRARWGIHPAWEVPVVLMMVFLTGCLQHRIALIGHEASHGLLLPNRAWNDWLANLLIFHPLFSSVAMYRKRHLPHHLHPNDPVRDLNLSGGKLERIWARFPMTQGQFVRSFYLKFFWPPFVLRNLLDLFLILAVESRGEVKARGSFLLQPGLLGCVYFVMIALITVVAPLAGVSSAGWVGLSYLLAVIVWGLLPSSAFLCEGSFAGSLKAAALLRLTFSTALVLTLGLLMERLGGGVIVWYCLLWILPLIYVFPYLMLLREVYQHANAGTGVIDNSRILFVDPFTRWAVLGYGNDLHAVHHLYPNIPHDRLAEVHETLMRESSVYREGIQQTRGLLRGSGTEPGLLDSLSVRPGLRDSAGQ
jgi:fatty acid desaturase